MESSRSSPPAEHGEPRRAPDVTAPNARADATFPGADSPVLAAVRQALVAFAAQRATPTPDAGLRVAVALSGGRDSMALLDALACVVSELGFALCALHVHHGLSPNADRWAAFCADECAQRGIALTVER